MNDIYNTTPPNEEVEDEILANEDLNSGRGRKTANGRKANLLRGVLDRGRQGQKEESVLDSKETTPDQSHDEDQPASTGTPSEDTPRVDDAEIRWMTHSAFGSSAADRNVLFKRDYFHLYATLNIYCFFRVFQMLYDRLLKIKLNEEQVKIDVQRGETDKAANDLGWVEKRPSDYFADISPSANYYRQILAMCEEVVKQEEDLTTLEETLRRFYMQKGWLLSSFDKMLASLLRFALNILVSDNKDKSLDIVNLFYKDRKEDETTHQAELTYRKQVEKLSKDGDVYRIRYVRNLLCSPLSIKLTMTQNRASKSAFIKIFKKDEKTYEADELAATARWSYYMSTFTMRDRTEGVSLANINWPFVKRNMPEMLGDEDEYNNAYGTPQWNEDNLIIRIGQENYHIMYDPGTSEWFIHNDTVRKRGLGAYEDLQKQRNQKYQELFGEKGELVAKKDGDGLEKETADFKQWITNGLPTDTAATNIGDKADDADETMGGT